MVQVIVFVPEKAKEKMKEAMFAAGAGKLGHYDSCCFEHSGVGQFRPLPGSHPYLGVMGELEQVPEVRIEMMCEDHLIEPVIKAMKASHPYETPAYYAIKTLGI
jgi:hypothetical protein